MALSNIPQFLMSSGIAEYLLPFLLTLAIVYGILFWAMKDSGGGTKMPKSAIGLISLIVAFFVMIYADFAALTPFFAKFFGAWAIVLSGILFIIIMWGLLGFKSEDLFDTSKSGKWAKWTVILAIVAIGIVIFFGAGAEYLIPSMSLGSDFWTMVFVIVIIAIVFFFLSGSDNAGTIGK